MNTKFLILLTAVAATLGWRAAAQTNNTTDVGVQTNANEVRTGIVTNKVGHVQDIRVVNGQAYDVTTSKKWVSITIPAGSGLWNEDKIHFTGTVEPIDVVFNIPVAHGEKRIAFNAPVVNPTTAVIHNFPYDPKYFYKSSPNPQIKQRSEIKTRFPLILRVFPLSYPRTNWTALGEMKITPAQPDFDFGLPCTNQMPDVQEMEVKP